MRSFFIRRSSWVAFVALLTLGLAGEARAFEFFDGRLQIHGFGETIARTTSSDFDDNWDLTQWQFLLNLELELDIAPDGFGPFSAVSAYSRVEVRYDCVWRRACGLSSSSDAFGDRPNKGQFWYLNANDRSTLFRGTTFANTNPTDGGHIHPGQRYIPLAEHPLLDTVNEATGPDGVLGTADDPGPFILGRFGDYETATRRTRGSIDGQGAQIAIGWRPKDKITAVGALRNTTNCLSTMEACGITGSPLSGLIKPFRPEVENMVGTKAPATESQGLYFPSAGLQRELENGGKLTPYDVNFRQRELEFNRGGSQQDEKELRELYLDIEMFDGRLWLRMGKQTIVWGKTEIFRSQDQFNPQDVGLSTLPSLEESRIPLWAARAVWSFYEVGPLEDVRLELAVILDDFEPIDIGRCGEPYAPYGPACGKQTALFIHGITGLGLAGEDRPPAWWNDSHGLEYGARLEFRWRRFSFALTNYYGYNDAPYADPIFNYQRNVDPTTGRPRTQNTFESCDPESLFGGNTSGCLGGPRGDRLPDRFVGNATLNVPQFSNDITSGRIPDARDRFNSNVDDIRDNTAPNQTLFHFICTGTVGFSDLFPGLESECSFGVFGSGVLVDVGFTFPVAEGIGHAFAGSNAFVGLLSGAGLSLVANLSVLTPLVPANILDRRTGEGRETNSLLSQLVPAGNISGVFTPEQQALLGCGAYYGTSCDTDGVDLMNAEAGALLQSFPSWDGTPLFGFTTFHRGQPGTVNFDGGQPCQRFERGRTFILPGCRGPGDPGYDPDVDGDPVFNTRFQFGFVSDLEVINFNNAMVNFRAAAGLAPCPMAVSGVGQRLYNPFTCEDFRSEMAVVSYNFLQLAVLFSQDLGGTQGDLNDPENFDVLDPNRLFDTDRCSYSTPQFCSVVRALFSVTGAGRQTIKAAGNGKFGRRDFSWHTGQELVLRYAKRNVLGFSTDFSEDYTKTNWSVEFTWVEELPIEDRNSRDGLTEVDTYNLTISMDRPTFVNFLNANRTFLFNTQWFIRYQPQVDSDFSTNGAWNVLGTFTVLSGYFQDRLLTALTLVYDTQSTSGAGLPSLTYRFTESFSAQFGLAFFFGRFQPRDPFLTQRAPTNRVGRHAYTEYVENGLALVRDRDEAFLRVRMTF